MIDNEITFMIPAYNEEKCIPRLIESIRNYVPSSTAYEIIVVDNGSTDNTVKTARNCGAAVYIKSDVTIGGLRNIAAKHARGNVFVFLDADMQLTRKWQENIVSVLSSLNRDPMQVTGSRCSIPPDAGWIERFWFKPLLAGHSNYINSGHLITSRQLFNSINGFDSSLKTGEDYDFSIRAKKVGAKIINNPELVVIHSGYPKTVGQFMRREMWHGIGDCVNFRVFLSSKVALASLLVTFSSVFALLLMLSGKYVYVGLTLLFFVLLVCVLSGIYKHKVSGCRELLVVVPLYYLYYLSRMASCIYMKNDGGARAA